MSDVKEICDTILGEDTDIVLNIPLKDLIWTIICFSKDMSNIEKEAFKSYPYYPLDSDPEEVDRLLEHKEYLACRRDELARLIGQYSDFDTQRIWSETDKLFKDYSTINNGKILR